MLGLLRPTDPRWIDHALADFDAVLVDHLHCELKAASNAVALIARYPQHASLVRELTALAQEELSHVAQVNAQLERRGVRAGLPSADTYATALRRACSQSPGTHEPLLDRLCVAALIEARSCERFSLLRDHAPSDDLRAWYAELFASEARHHRVFLLLAEEIFGETRARERFAALAASEAEIITTLPLLARVH